MYSELCEKLFEQNANNYMAVFNELDKYFDTLVGTEKFMPYNEKIKSIGLGKNNVAFFVKKNAAKLKYFGELRNHIAHGFKLDGKHYAIPSYHAVDELRKIKDAIVQPVTIGSVFKKQVYTCFLTDSLQEVLQNMRNFRYTHVPVYDERRVLQGVITQSTVCDRLVKQMHDPVAGVQNVLVKDIDLSLGNEGYMVIAESQALTSIPTLFEPTGLNQKRMGVLLITEKGESSEPLTGIITALDLSLVTNYTYNE